MKKGCFLRIIIIITILTAVVLYLVTYKFNEVILNPGKSLIINQINRDLEYVKDSPEKDSLKQLIKDYIHSIKKVDKLSDKSIGEFIDTLRVALSDSVIDDREYKSLYNILHTKVEK
jgi:tRNA C32,U32 (ribose-2'-O)-methylase TrmJ